MQVTLSDVFDVPVIAGTIFTFRGGAAYDRIFSFRNLTANSTLAILIEHSADGGTTWTTAVASFNLTPGVLAEKTVASTLSGILRITASGGEDDRDLMLGLNYILGFGNIWTNPTL